MISVISFVACIALNAQGTCIINGNIADVLLNDGSKVKKVYLTRTDEMGRNTDICSAKVKNGQYTIKYKMAQDEPAMLYTITGFGENQGIELFVEPGEVTISTERATEPENSIVKGTATNDLLSEYKSILKSIASDPSNISAVEKIRMEAERIRFLIDHNKSPLAPYEMLHSLVPFMSESYANQLVTSVSTTLHSHPYYKQLRNSVLARCLKVGNEAPDVTLTLPDCTLQQLSDYRGKYILVHAWETGNEKATNQLEAIKELYQATKDKQEKFVIVSLSFDKDAKAWKEAMDSNGINQAGWVHSCDLAGTDSPAAKMLGIDTAPRIMLFDPECRAISLDMTDEEALERVAQILAGDLYYLDREE